MADDWTCHWMNDCVRYVISELGRRGLIRSWVNASDVWEGILAPCQPCGAGARSHKKCRGWRLAFRSQHALYLAPTEIKAHTIQPIVEGKFDTNRGAKSGRRWSADPMRECNAAFYIVDAQTEALLTRQHLDLANEGQPGPVWHLQLGGVGTNDDRAMVRAVATLRWPALPMDFILLIEQALFLFHHDHWRELRNTSPWRYYVQASEELVLTHYLEAFNGYWNQRERGSHYSWLGMQCNETGAVSPRPTD